MMNVAKNPFMQSVVILVVVMLNVIMLCVVAPLSSVGTILKST